MFPVNGVKGTLVSLCKLPSCQQCQQVDREHLLPLDLECENAVRCHGSDGPGVGEVVSNPPLTPN